MDGPHQGGGRGGYQNRDNRGPNDRPRPYDQQNRMPMGGPTPTQQLMGAQPQPQPQMQQGLVSVDRLNQLANSPDQRRQEIGNAIYPIIQNQYNEHASKITGMLLDNEQVVDPVKLVTDMQYLNQKALEAYSLLQENFSQSQ